MTCRGRLALGLGTLALAGAQALAPQAMFAQSRSMSAQSLAAKITKMYAWAVPKLIPRTADGKQFSLSIYQKGKVVSLEQGIGATLLNLYITELPKQPTYYLTTYSVAQAGAPVWQYIYTPATKRLVRYHFVTAHPTQVAIWYITPGGIAKAAKVGHWPTPTTH
jgi:hypothetical protein